MTSMNSGMSRRSVLIGAAAVSGIGLLSACGRGEGSGPTVPNGEGNAASFAMPAHLPFDGPEPDFPGTDDGVNAGYLSYPHPSELAVTHPEPPGDGEPITAMTSYWNAAVPAAGDNSFWQHINEKLGSPWELQMVPGSDYGQVFATASASGEMPDMFTVPPTPQLPALLAAQAVDLTDYLAGDAIAAYPNLANNPQAAWQFTTYNGRGFTLPIYRGVLQSRLLFKRTDLLAEAGMDADPSNFEEFFEWASELNDPAGNRWAFARFPSELIMQTLGLPNIWEENDGVFSTSWEREEFEEYLAAGRRIVDAGLMHPGAFTGTGHKENFYNGNAYFVLDSMSAWRQYYVQFDTAYPGEIDTFDITGVEVFDYQDGMTGVPWRGKSVAKESAIGKGAEDRVETILKVLDWLAAPLGSQEKFEASGIEGQHFNWEDGQLISTDLASAERFNWSDLIAAPAVNISPYPSQVRSLHEFQTWLAPIAVANAADGLYSEANLSEGASLTMTMDNGLFRIQSALIRAASWPEWRRQRNT